MTLPYSATEGDGTVSPAVQDVVPRGERSQDELRSEITNEMTSAPARPLTHDEQEAAEHDTPRGERVYAPASERVPRAPVPGHRELIEHPDESTPERQATPPGNGTAGTVRHTRGRRRVRVPLGSAVREEEDPTTTGQLFGFGAAWFGLFVLGAAGMWLFLRWQRERNRPVNRFRRQARWAADEIRERVPATADNPTTAMGLAAALLSTGLMVWRRMHASSEDESEALDSDTWQPRLKALRDRIPTHVEAEAKFSLS
jgi:hypothetical protein